ncbi:hypothetical protein [Chromatium okenii]|uniref:InlB B-repeat-containing protein n=1 Tax=Chromatium okenii TaxID=61644 RepID=UPI0026EF157D|nr:hypothetical protein [Chromatium okenii]MBV5310299.1 hypothetical protein [Chromatium okenii]
MNPSIGGSVNCSVNLVSYGGSSNCTATSKTGYNFSGFSGDCSGTSCSLTNVTSNKTVTANFTAITYPINATANPSIGGNVICSVNPVTYGGSSNCTATPKTGYNFSGFSGDCSGTSCSLTNVTANKTVTANFTALFSTFRLTVTKTGNGTISSNPNGINCGSDCTENFASGKTVTLIAQPDTGATFVSWSGCSAVAANPLQCTLKMSKAQTVTATFATIPTPTGGNLTVKTVGNGNVTSNPAGISCGTGTNCTASFSSDTAVMLTALPATGETFRHWNGCTAAISNPNQCRVTPSSGKSVTATFSMDTTPVADVRVMAIAINPATPAAKGNFKRMYRNQPLK